MAKDKTKKKKSSSDPTEGMSAKEKMMARKKKIAERGKGGVVFLKEGTTRVRLKSPGPTEEIAMEKTSEDEISNLDALKIGMMMEGMERHTIKKMIEG